MNTRNIKSYAPKARTAFIAAMTKRAALFGICDSSIPSIGIAPVEQKGDLALIGERAFPASIIPPRAALVKKVEQLGFAQTMEQAAYSWFNRLCAIRYMELKDYLDHGLRVLSHPAQQGSFQILDDCLEINLPGLDKQRIAELKLDGNKDEELYRELLLAQCHALHQAMPFLFEAVDDSTELLLPDNLTKTDSLIRELVRAIPEDDWVNIEIIGWLYQFYISEKKDQVIGKVVKSEDIPAATQLFTPNWIVKYMVQNSLGAKWLGTYPQSPLKAQMAYYIEPAEQTDEVNAQLTVITPSALSPEELTLIDPASGSGHILVEAYDLLKAIYLERGYRKRDVAQLILEKNLFGFDIDERAAQLTGFALMMKGREDDRRLFERGVKLNVMAFQNSLALEPEKLIESMKLADFGLQPGDLTELKQLFEDAATFGSLIQVPEGLARKLPALKQLSEELTQDLFVSDALKLLGPLVRQAELLAAQYDAVVANPPYMNGRSFTQKLKQWLRSEYSGYDKDLFSAFIVRMLILTKESGHSAIMTSFVWMFISSFEPLRRKIVSLHSIASLIQLHYDAFADAKAHVCTFVLQKQKSRGFRAPYVRLSDFPGVDNQAPKTLEAIQQRDCGWLFEAAQDDFEKIPGSPIAYWISDAQLAVFDSPPISSFGKAGVGLQTGNNDKFIRYWFEVNITNICSSRDDTATHKWAWCNKGGAFRKWFGNTIHVINWENDGAAIKANVPSAVIRNESEYFKKCITWSKITSSHAAFRFLPNGQVHNDASCFVRVDDEEVLHAMLGYLNSPVRVIVLERISPTVNLVPGQVDSTPFVFVPSPGVEECIRISAHDWDKGELSRGFANSSLFRSQRSRSGLNYYFDELVSESKACIATLLELERNINEDIIGQCGLLDELSPDVPVEQITLSVNPAYRYGGKLTEVELWTRFREDSMQELVSYAIGCMMGRYSLDEPGLIYAHSSNEGFDASSYATFPADDDGILPLTDKEWFSDDAANRLVEFIGLAWDKAHLEDNLCFLADNLSPKKGESSRDTLRRYLSDSFFKDHLQTYKKRPIYWLFSSGKHKAFQCLVYLHRYNENTLARMRILHVVPLSAKLNSYASKLELDIEATTSTAEKKRLEKELATLHNQQAELTTFDEKLRHCADQRISLDLDEGVKVNYGKFGDLLAEVKAVTGDKGD